jgi:hypothetical protein
VKVPAIVWVCLAILAAGIGYGFTWWFFLA